MTAEKAEGGTRFDGYLACRACLRRTWCALTASGWRCAECLSADALDRLLAVNAVTPSR